MKRSRSHLQKRLVDYQKTAVAQRAVTMKHGLSKEELRAIADVAIEHCPIHRIEQGKKTMTRARWVY